MPATLESLDQRLTALEKKIETRIAVRSLARISGIYPKEKSVVFVGLGYFGDNIKYAFLAFSDYAKKKGIRCAFLTEDAAQRERLAAAGLPVIGSKDPAYMQTLLGARVAVLQDAFYPMQSGIVPHALLQGAKFVQLWHGIPMKEIGLTSQAHFEIMEACGPYEALVATNAASEKDWARRFAFRRFAAVGYPRDDVLFREAEGNDLLNVDAESLKALRAARQAGRRTILYAPTFRDNEPSLRWFEKSGVAGFAARCRERGHVLKINLHPGEQNAIPALRARCPDLDFIAPHTDIYPVLKEVDVLVTDYSSLAFDHMLLGRRQVYYRPDHDEYVAKSRPMIPGREHYAAGPVVSEIDGLMAAVEAAEDSFAAKRKKLVKELYDRRDGKSGERFCKLISKILKD